MQADYIVHICSPEILSNIEDFLKIQFKIENKNLTKVYKYNTNISPELRQIGGQ